MSKSFADFTGASGGTNLELARRLDQCGRGGAVVARVRSICRAPTRRSAGGANRFCARSAASASRCEFHGRGAARSKTTKSISSFLTAFLAYAIVPNATVDDSPEEWQSG